MTLIDHADFYLVRTRSSAWLKRFVQVHGDWPDAGQSASCAPFIGGLACGRYGTRGITACVLIFLLASLDKVYFKGRPVLHAYARARTACCDRELGRLRLDASARLRTTFLKILGDNEQIMAVIDVPADSFNVRQSVNLLGKKAQVPNGLMRLAVDRRVPVTLFLTDIDFQTGQRTLVIKTLGVFDNVDSLAARAFALLDDAIRTSPPSWHLWSEAPRFFELNDY